MTKQPEALRLADLIDTPTLHGDLVVNRAAAELRRQHELIQELTETLRGLDEAYCRADQTLTRDERTEDRKRLIAARAALARAKGEA